MLKCFICFLDFDTTLYILLQALYTFVDRLQENKADKEHVTMEIDIVSSKVDYYK